MVYFVVFKYKNRETLFHFADYSRAADHFDDLVAELPPHARVAIFLAEPRASVTRGICESCPTIERCSQATACARLDAPDRRG